MPKTIMHFIIVIILMMFLNSNKMTEVIAFDYTCNPSTDCEARNPGEKVPDPDFCDKYFLCVTSNGGSKVFSSDKSISCPTNQSFDLSLGDCRDRDSEMPCKDSCLNYCRTECEKAGDAVVYPGDCHKFYFCQSATSKVVGNCSTSKPNFNGLTCTNNTNECCDNCLPFCKSAFIQTMDPRNCTNFYICSSEGPANDTDIYSCDTNQYFEPIVGKCVPNLAKPCAPLCS